MKLREALAIKSGEVVSLVGGGGKTTLMFALARELASVGESVITTTTTRILEPSPSETHFLLLERDEDRLIDSVLQSLDKHQHITLAAERLPSGKLKGISSKLVSRLAGLGRVFCLIVEADGAARKSLKAPNPTEPVIPPNTSLVIPVVGIDAIDCPLTKENVFRPENVSRLTGLPLGEVVSAGAITILITHPEGIIKGSPVQSRIVPFINKVDLDKGVSKATSLASSILAVGHPQIGRVILGQVQLAEPVVGSIRAPGISG